MSDQPEAPFHLAFPVNDLSSTEQFYAETLGCAIGRRSDSWIDFDFFGHQITAHLRPDECRAVEISAVDGDDVPVRHFGAVLAWEKWEALARHLSMSGMDFLIKPRVRFQGQTGEQGTFFVRDPSGNAVEFKSFKNFDQIFATGEEA